MRRILLILMICIICCELVKAHLRHEMLEAEELAFMNHAAEVVLQIR